MFMTKNDIGSSAWHLGRHAKQQSLQHVQHCGTG